MKYFYIVPFLLTLLFFVFVVLIICGRKIAERRIAADPVGGRLRASEVQAAIFALLGLLIAFTFYGAGQRFDVRREMIVKEANAINVSWLRIGLLPASIQPQMRELFRQYIDARISVADRLPDQSDALRQEQVAHTIQQAIWSLAMTNLTSLQYAAPLLVLPALNEMFDIAVAHNVAFVTHPPPIIYITLLALTLISCILVGYSLAGGKRANLLHEVGFALVMSVILFVIIDLEFPRSGTINMKFYDFPMKELRQNMMP